MLRFVVVCALAACAFAVPVKQDDSIVGGLLDLYSSCSGGDQDMSVCLKLKALGVVDRAARSVEIDLIDGVKIVQSEEAKKSSRENAARSLNDIEASLPAETEAKEAAVDEALYDRAARFLSTHTVELSMPEQVSRSIGDARGKKKKIVKSLLPILLLLKLKAAALIPIALGGLALLAFKALVIGKIALIISAVLALQKLLGNKGQSYEVVAHDIPHHHDEHHGGGWGRSLAYSAHKPATE